MPADLAHRFLANMSLLNAKKRAPISNVLETTKSTQLACQTFGHGAH